MMIGGRELILHQGFIQALLELEKWAGRHDASKGRALVKRIVDFACDTIAPLPLSFPAYPFSTAPTRALRRAVLNRQYAVVYEVHETELLFVYVYSTLQNADALTLPEPD